MLSLEDGTSNHIVTLCSKCAKKESLEDSSLLTITWDKLKVGTKKYYDYKNKTYTCEIAKTRENYVTIEVREMENSTTFDNVVLTRNQSQGRIDFYIKRFRYSLGFVAREFLIDLLVTHHQEVSYPQHRVESFFWEAREQVIGIRGR